MEEKILNEILKDTFTLDSLKKRVMLLKIILEREIYRGKVAAEEPQTDLEVREEKWLAGFDKELIAGLNSDMYSSLSQKIEKFIGGINSLTIYFVFIPDETIIKGVGLWLRKNLDQPRLVFDFKTDPTLIGGCAIVYKGIYKDLSLRARITDSREQIIGEFKKYFRE